MFMVKFIKNEGKVFPEYLKIQYHPGFIEFCPGDSDFNVPVMTMKFFTLSFIIAQTVCCSKFSDNFKFEH